MVMQLRPYYDLGHGATLSLCFSPFYIKSEVHLQKVWTQIRAEFRPDLHSKLFDTDSIPERIICKVNFENQPANYEKKIIKHFLACIELRINLSRVHTGWVHTGCACIWYARIQGQSVQLINS